MHITGDLSLRRLRHAIELNNGAAYPKLADYLHTADPGHEVHHRRREVLRRGVGDRRRPATSRVRLSSRRIRRHRCPTGAATCRSRRSGTAGGGSRSARTCRVPTVDRRPDLCGRYFINSDAGNDYGTKAAFPSWMYPRTATASSRATTPARAPRRRHLGGRRRDRDDEPRDLVGHVRHAWAASTRPPTCGEPRTTPRLHGDCTGDPRRGAAQTHVRCAAENADVQLGKMLDAVEALDAERRRRHPGRADRRPRRDVRRALLRQEDRRRRRQQLVLRAANLGVWDAGTVHRPRHDRSTTNPSPDLAAADRRRQRRSSPTSRPRSRPGCSTTRPAREGQGAADAGACRA